MAPSVQSLIASCVNQVIRQYYPEEYCSLCHVYAVVGSNLISIVLDRVYRPVAGLAAIDCGAGQRIVMADNAAFGNPAGGAFHCWIESADEQIAECELVDLTFRHNHVYAEKNGFQWRKELPPDFLWGERRELALEGEIAALPSEFPDGTLWLCETPEGVQWMTRQLMEHQGAFVTLTAEALKLFNVRMRAGLPARSDAGPRLAAFTSQDFRKARPACAGQG